MYRTGRRSGGRAGRAQPGDVRPTFRGARRKATALASAGPAAGHRRRFSKPHRGRLVRHNVGALGSIPSLSSSRRKAPAHPAPLVAAGWLVDAPCSGLGVLRPAARTPRWRIEPEAVDRAGRAAARTARRRRRVVRPGGVVVYSVATLPPRRRRSASTGVCSRAILVWSPWSLGGALASAAGARSSCPRRPAPMHVRAAAVGAVDFLTQWPSHRPSILSATSAAWPMPRRLAPEADMLALDVMDGPFSCPTSNRAAVVKSLVPPYRLFFDCHLS